MSDADFKALCRQVGEVEDQFHWLSQSERRDPMRLRTLIRRWLNAIDDNPDIGDSKVVALLLEALDAADKGGSTAIFAVGHKHRGRAYGLKSDAAVMGTAAAVLEYGVSVGEQARSLAGRIANALYDRGLGNRSQTKPGPYSGDAVQLWLKECRAGTHAGIDSYRAAAGAFDVMHESMTLDMAFNVLHGTCRLELGAPDRETGVCVSDAKR